LTQAQPQAQARVVVPFFKDGTRFIARHELNNRAHTGVKRGYIVSVKARGIVKGVRGEAWLVAPATSIVTNMTQATSPLPFLAITYGTLHEA
jgi:hypothetical protein